MEEKKKRWRPSLTAYRELESENGKLKAERFQFEDMRVQCEAVIDKNRVLEQSNKLMEKELETLREQAKGATVDYNKARREVLWLRNRNLWQRIINKQYEE